MPLFGSRKGKRDEYSPAAVVEDWEAKMAKAPPTFQEKGPGAPPPHRPGLPFSAEHDRYFLWYLLNDPEKRVVDLARDLHSKSSTLRTRMHRLFPHTDRRSQIHAGIVGRWEKIGLVSYGPGRLRCELCAEVHRDVIYLLEDLRRHFDRRGYVRNYETLARGRSNYWRNLHGSLAQIRQLIAFKEKRLASSPLWRG